MASSLNGACSLLPSKQQAQTKAAALAASSSFPLPSAIANCVPQHSIRNKTNPRRVLASAAQEAPSAVTGTAAAPERGTAQNANASASLADGTAAGAAPAAPEVQDPSAFISDVTSLIKLVDSRDIVELEMKHANYEILIRKKEAVEAASAKAQESASPHLQTFPGPHVMAHTAPFPYPSSPMSYAPAPPPAAPAAAPAPPAPAPPKAPANAGLPPMLSPMAGTFYRSPAPGEPSFVKVGDRIQKGQVVCIIEAMKLMNEIEADASGTVVEFLAEDGKAVAIESPLLVIKP